MQTKTLKKQVVEKILLTYPKLWGIRLLYEELRTKCLELFGFWPFPYFQQCYLVQFTVEKSATINTGACSFHGPFPWNKRFHYGIAVWSIYYSCKSVENKPVRLIGWQKISINDYNFINQISACYSEFSYGKVNPTYEEMFKCSKSKTAN